MSNGGFVKFTPRLSTNNSLQKEEEHRSKKANVSIHSPARDLDSKEVGTLLENELMKNKGGRNPSSFKEKTFAFFAENTRNLFING